MGRLPFVCTLWVLTLAFTACASEDWDNPKDPESPAFQKACFGVPATDAETCVFWEAFDHGLSRWQVGPSPDGVKPIRILPAPEGVSVTTVLALPGCPVAGAPGLQVEVLLPRSSTELSVVWMAAPESDGQLSIGINGAQQVPDSQDAEGEFAGWKTASVILNAYAGETIVVGLLNTGQEGPACHDEGVRVARVRIRGLAQ